MSPPILFAGLGLVSMQPFPMRLCHYDPGPSRVAGSVECVDAHLTPTPSMSPPILFAHLGLALHGTIGDTIGYSIYKSTRSWTHRYCFPFMEWPIYTEAPNQSAMVIYVIFFVTWAQISNFQGSMFHGASYDSISAQFTPRRKLISKYISIKGHPASPFLTSTFHLSNPIPSPPTQPSLILINVSKSSPWSALRIWSLRLLPSSPILF